jgi:hypothetical protein
MAKEEQAERSAEKNGNDRPPTVSKRRQSSRGNGGDTPSLSAAVSDARQSVTSLLDDWTDMVQESPLKALGLALAAGYVVGGGLLTTLTGRLLLGGARIGFRLAALPMVRDELMGLVDNMGERGRGETERRHQ